jgi:DNA gyrase subunit B
MAKQAQYSAEQIKQLDGLEAVRRLPGMYIGNNSVHGLHHLLNEIIDNSVDEHLNEYGDRIIVVIEPDGSVAVTDYGRGIPPEYKPSSEMSALTEALTKLHAGGKFRGEDEDVDAYLSGSGGLHGVGIKATNAFSEWMVVTVRRWGVSFRQRFEDGGKPVTDVEIIDATGKAIGSVDGRTKLIVEENILQALKVGRSKVEVVPDPDLETGTTVAFRPDRQWFDKTMDWPNPKQNVPWDWDRVATRLQQVAHLYPGLMVEFTDRRGKKEKVRVYHSENGLVDYVRELNEGQSPLHKPIHFVGRDENEGITVEVAMQYAGEETEIYSFVNGIPTPRGGTAVSGFQSGLTRAVNQFASEKKLAKDSTIRGDDVQLGLTAVMKITMRQTPQFSSQTKDYLTSPEAQGVALSITYNNILEHLRGHISVGRAIVRQAEAAAKGRAAARQARKLVFRKSPLEASLDSGVLGKLADVTKGAPLEQTTLFIVEGDSAGGSCKQARDRRYHAILPLRGKVLNTERAHLNRVLANKEVAAIIAAVGAGVGPDFKLDDMRYQRVAILVDADVDGSHIRTLLHTLFWRYMRPMVEEGRLYVARAPLYLLQKGQRKAAYAYSDLEREEIVSRWGGTNGLTVQRYKGLGEMNPEQLRETVFCVDDPETGLNPHLLRVTVDDVHLLNTVLSTLMGRSVRPRKTWIMEQWSGNGDVGEDDEDEGEE